MVHVGADGSLAFNGTVLSEAGLHGAIAHRASHGTRTHQGRRTGRGKTRHRGHEILREAGVGRLELLTRPGSAHAWRRMARLGVGILGRAADPCRPRPSRVADRNPSRERVPRRGGRDSPGAARQRGRRSRRRVEATLDAEVIGDVEGARDVAPREATPTPPETASPPLPEDIVALAAPETDTRPPPRRCPRTRRRRRPPSPEDAVEPAAPEADTRLPPITAPLPLPEDIVALAALEADTRPPSETAISTIPEPAMPPPADAALLPAAEAAGDLPPRETASTPPPRSATPEFRKTP